MALASKGLQQFRDRYRDVVDRLYARAGASQWDVTADAFAEALYRSACHRFGQSDLEFAPIESYLDSLRLEELALAVGCAAGHEKAWQTFVARYRPRLYAAARSIAGEQEARDLAGSIYGELYGLKEEGGQRRSLFQYYYGRSSLPTWLSAVLAQRHVDALRASSRLEPLDSLEKGEAPALEPAASGNPESILTRRRYVAILTRVVRAALGELSPNERLRLTQYYLDGLTLAQAAAMFGEHESTASRKLERLRQSLRARIEQKLRDEYRLDDLGLRECLAVGIENWTAELKEI
ncbi:MAG: sigma-70 family RNA polymerase sigma factor [Acidobacteria bacterium]|nr:sigma-70 family RNA polymerase sigma factor [Acidobacteriota bacterium]